MKTGQVSHLQQLKAYRSDLFQRQTGAAGSHRAEAGEAARDRQVTEAEQDSSSTASTPRELSKGRLLDIYG